MSAALNGIRAKVGAENCGESCSRDGCGVDLTGAPTDHVIVDVDKAFLAQKQKQKQEDKRCDFILFMDRPGAPILAAPVELKSGRPDASEAIEQLQSGADFAADLAPLNADCRPVLIHGRGLHPAERNRLNQGKIVFRGRKTTVGTAQCGQPRNLARALSG